MHEFKGAVRGTRIRSKEATSQVAWDSVKRKRQIIILLRRILFYNKKFEFFLFLFAEKKNSLQLFWTHRFNVYQNLTMFHKHIHVRTFKCENDFELRLRLSPCTASFDSVCNTRKVFKNISPTNIFWSDWATKF